ncbi:MAG: tetratricopeptide repeat protein [Bacteroidota bacterium]
MNNIGMAYDLMNNETLALQYHQQALAMNQKIGNTDGIGNSLTNIGNSYLKLKQFERAKGFFPGKP